jgi:flagellar biogenesis protein FliO
LALVRFGAENLVLGVTPQSITVLAKAEALIGAEPEEQKVDAAVRCEVGAAQVNSHSECP